MNSLLYPVFFIHMEEISNVKEVLNLRVYKSHLLLYLPTHNVQRYDIMLGTIILI